METNRIENRGGKMSRERLHAKFLVLRVDTARSGIFAFCMQQVTQVVKQSGGYQVRFSAMPADIFRGLQAVFEHGDGLAKVGFATACSENIENIIDLLREPAWASCLHGRRLAKFVLMNHEDERHNSGK